jgi:hypothetical protein
VKKTADILKGDTLAALAARRAARGLPPPDAMARYLDAALAEAARHLRASAGVPAVAAVLEEVEALRRRLDWPGPGGAESPDPGGIPSMTRAALRDVERAALVDGFRERCAGLASRLADPEGNRAALDELRAAVPVLARVLNLGPKAA